MKIKRKLWRAMMKHNQELNAFNTFKTNTIIKTRKVLGRSGLPVYHYPLPILAATCPVQGVSGILCVACQKKTETATKHDDGKPPISMIPRVAIEQEAQVLLFGAKKYGRDNWKKGMAPHRLYDAALRHILAYADGETTDPESGLPHLAHARCNLGFLLHYAKGEQSV